MTKKFFCTLALVTTLVVALVLMFSAPAAAQQAPGTKPKVHLATHPQVGIPPIHTLSSVPPTCGNPSGACLFYGGDFDPSGPNPDAVSNENDLLVGGSPYGSAVYVPVALGKKGVKGKADWNITQLFTNNLSFSGTGTIDPAVCFWTINTGVMTGSGGTVVATGTDACTSTATGRSGFGAPEFTVQVTPATPPPTLEESTEYWLVVVPTCTNPSDGSCFSQWFETDVEDVPPMNAVGPAEPLDMSFFDSPFFGFSFFPTGGPSGLCGGFGCDAFSAGLIGTHAK